MEFSGLSSITCYTLPKKPNANGIQHVSISNYIGNTSVPGPEARCWHIWTTAVSQILSLGWQKSHFCVSLPLRCISLPTPPQDAGMSHSQSSTGQLIYRTVSALGGSKVLSTYCLGSLLKLSWCATVAPRRPWMMQKGVWLSVNKTLFMKQKVSPGTVQATGSKQSASGFASTES